MGITSISFSQPTTGRRYLHNVSCDWREKPTERHFTRPQVTRVLAKSQKHTEALIAWTACTQTFPTHSICTLRSFIFGTKDQRAFISTEHWFISQLNRHRQRTPFLIRLIHDRSIAIFTSNILVSKQNTWEKHKEVEIKSQENSERQRSEKTVEETQYNWAQIFYWFFTKWLLTPTT